MTLQFSGGLESYKRTPDFTEASVPSGLLKDHSTKDRARSLIHVTAGHLRYAVTDARCGADERILKPDTAPGLVEPTILHRVEPLGPVSF